MFLGLSSGMGQRKFHLLTSIELVFWVSVRVYWVWGGGRDVELVTLPTHGLVHHGVLVTARRRGFRGVQHTSLETSAVALLLALLAVLQYCRRWRAERLCTFSGGVRQGTAVGQITSHLANFFAKQLHSDFSLGLENSFLSFCIHGAPPPPSAETQSKKYPTQTVWTCGLFTAHLTRNVRQKRSSVVRRAKTSRLGRKDIKLVQLDGV